MGEEAESEEEEDMDKSPEELIREIEDLKKSNRRLRLLLGTFMLLAVIAAIELLVLTSPKVNGMVGRLLGAPDRSEEFDFPEVPPPDYFARITVVDAPALPDDGEPVALSFDYPNPSSRRYVYHQEGVTSHQDRPGIRVTVDGAMEVSVDDQGLKIALRDMKQKTVFLGGDDDHTMESEFPDNELTFLSGSSVIGITGFFVMPDKPLKVGEQVEVRSEIPANLQGGRGKLEMISTIRLERVVEIGGVKCAELSVNGRSGRLQKPESSQGTFDVMMEYRGLYYIELEQGGLNSLKAASIFNMKASMNMPKMKIDGEQDKDLPSSMDMDMTQYGLVELTPAP
jgi:hypothetical protein